jgi:Holliday junction resolvase-like predicted endonuclease
MLTGSSIRSSLTTAGRKGEDWVAVQLEQAGWQILHRNFRRRGFEIDIIAKKQKTLKAIEVKTRNTTIDFQLFAAALRKQSFRIYKGIRYLLSFDADLYATIETIIGECWLVEIKNQRPSLIEILPLELGRDDSL